MLDLLHHFLVGNATPEMSDSITEAYKLLENMNAGDLDFDLNDMLMVDDVVDTNVTMSKIQTYFTTIQHDMLAQYGITMDDEVAIDDLTMVLKAVFELEDYEDTEALLRLTMSDMRADETFAEVLALITHKDAVSLLSLFEEVDTSLIRRIQDIASATDDELVTDEERIRRSQYMHHLQRFCHYINSKELEVVKMLKDGITVGYPYAAYADQIGRAFEGTIPEQVAREMVAMALISSDGHNNPMEVIKGSLEDYVADLNTVTKIHIEVTKLLQGFSRE